MLFFKQQRREEGSYSPYIKGPDTFWIGSNIDYTDHELQDLDIIPHVAIVINREPGVTSHYKSHYEISSGEVSLFNELLPIIRKIDSYTVITPAKVRTVLLNNGIKEIEYKSCSEKLEKR